MLDRVRDVVPTGVGGRSGACPEPSELPGDSAFVRSPRAVVAGADAGGRPTAT